MKYFVANWKMNMTAQDVLTWTEQWAKKESFDGKQIIIAPSYIHVVLVNAQNLPNVSLCVQDVSEHESGAHTSEISAKQAKEFCTYAIIGHSERASTQTHPQIIQKAGQCLKNSIVPIICFTNIQQAQHYYVKGALLAWEDPQNISQNGQYKPKDPEEIKTSMQTLKNSLPNDVEILYGGSVNIDNIEQIKAISQISGALVGNASTDANHFYEICKF